MSTIHDRKEARAWQRRHDPRAPKVGQSAPDFELVEAGSDRTWTLSQFRGRRPVALVFGSFT